MSRKDVIPHKMEVPDLTCCNSGLPLFSKVVMTTSLGRLVNDESSQHSLLVTTGIIDSHFNQERLSATLFLAARTVHSSITTTVTFHSAAKILSFSSNSSSAPQHFSLGRPLGA